MKDIYAILRNENFEVNQELIDYYKNIDKWRCWWRGYYPKFHKYSVTNIKKEQMQVKRRTLGMAKKISEDWANLLLNDKTLIKIEDTNAQAFLTGDVKEQNGGVFGLSKFWKNGNKAVEKEFALGTTAFILSLEKPQLIKNKLTGQNVRIKYIKDPKNIIPLSYSDGEVSECAFASEKVINGSKYIYLQIMQQNTSGGYTVSNKYYKQSGVDTYEKVEAPNGEVKSYNLPAKNFFLLSPNIENNIEDVPLGVSVYANAIDQLQSCDITFDNFYNDFLLGRKKVFMSESVISTQTATTKEDGKTITRNEPVVGDSIEQSLYVSVGKDLPGADKVFNEYNPEIRVEENKEGIQLSLNLLSSKVGFGQSKYQFQANTMNTATEVKASNKDLTESVWKQRIAIQDVITEMVKSILIIGKEKCGKSFDIDAKVSIQFDDTMFSDEEAERMRDLQEVRDGIMQKYEYRMKWYGEEEKVAKSKISEDKGIEFE